LKISSEQRIVRFCKNAMALTRVRVQPMPKSLGDVLSNPALRNKFRIFLKEKHAVESLLFYESAELYAKIDDAKWAKSAAIDIVSKFVSPDGICASRESVAALTPRRRD